ncbi:hypothetical protein [Paracraurococcus lichenis]|uniref:Uncharacterized protein n=1 Tax=Paracraurococcus lichenis TaxID=3064888 RepID=A0ABT9EES0_9PROT|nr:hypothetical protein [Paracraurococcus sp. LOR1-02]MDO9714611.1 hypothetical protein [Paracraurococcus sp. LOR1-02]
MPDFLANDFGAIARAMRRDEPVTAPKVVLHFWCLSTALTSEHESVEAAVATAYDLLKNVITDSQYIAAADGTVLMNRDALTGAMTRYDEGVPI